MTTDTPTSCALGVTSRALSDFRSDGLSAREMERLRAHVSQCPACQARLDALEAVARTLQKHPDLNGHAQLWSNVRASITAAASSAARDHRSAFGAGRFQSARLWTTLGSIAAVIALSVGFAAVFLSRGEWPPTSKSTTPTPITIHSGSLTWRQVIGPKGFPSGPDVTDIAYGGATVAPSDGNTVYACLATRRFTSTPHVWATHDAGVHWSNVTPAGLPGDVGGCMQWIDANDAQLTVVAFFPMLGSQQPAPSAQWVTYATTDGGATWSQPAGLRDAMLLGMMASAHGRIYAQRTSNARNGYSSTGLYVSRDGMQSWTRIDSTLPETQPNPPQIHDLGKVFQMWVSPSSGEVLALTFAHTLWSTGDDGAHWTKITYPQAVYTTDPRAPMLSVGGLTMSGRLTICGLFAPLRSPDTGQWLECTTDDGHTWSKRPTSTTSSRSAPAYPLDLAGVGADGSLYAVVQQPSAAGADNGYATLYRLPPGGVAPSDWQPLGAVPGSQHGLGYQIALSASGIVVWDFPSREVEGDGSGAKTYVQPNYYVATYP